MVIKKVKLSGFKNIEENIIKEYDFFGYTIISGENYSGKTTIGEAICWCLCGCNINGRIIYEDLLINKNGSSMFVEVYFIDNNGMDIIIRREKTKETNLFMNNIKILQKDVNRFIENKDIFMSIFVVGHFQKYLPKEARQIVTSVLPAIDTNEIYNCLPDEYKVNATPQVMNFPNEVLKSNKLKLKEIDQKRIFLKGELKGFNDLLSNKQENIIDDANLLWKLANLEKRKENLNKLCDIDKEITILKQKRDLLRKEYEFIKSKLKDLEFRMGDLCPVCQRSIDDECFKKLTRQIEETNNVVKKEMENIVLTGKELNRQIDSTVSFKSELEKEDFKKISLHDIENEINKIKAEHQANLSKNAEINAQRAIKDKALEGIKIVNQKIYNLDVEAKKIETINNIAIYCNSVRVNKQFENISRYLDRVTIKLEKIVKNSGEIKECFEINYDNKDMMLLSNSEKIRAALEISNLLNGRLGIKIPLFIDNAESITQYNRPDVQVIEARVVRNSQLTIENGEK